MATLKIYTELADIKTEYETGKIEIIDGLYFNQYQTIRMCEFYSNSRYLKGNRDGLGRDKPFYNIVNYRVALAKTATDLDIKDIQIQSDEPKDWVRAMFLNKELYKWLKESDFSYVLNKMGQTRPKYGGYLVKKCVDYDDESKKDEIKIEVVEWKNVRTNQKNILSGVINETHYMSPVDLMKKDGVWENIKEVLKQNKKINKNKSPDVIVEELLGEFPVSVFKEANGEEFTDEDEFTFTLQHYFIATVGNKNYTLFSEERKKETMEDTYRYLPWEEMSGRGLGRGIIEDSEEAQVWTNDAVINEKNVMDLAGKVGVKTNSKKIGNNVLEHDNGKVYFLEEGKTMETVQFAPSALGEFQNQINKWNSQATNATSSYDAVTGQTPPSNTPYSQTALLNQVAMKPFDYKRQEWGIHLSDMIEDWVLPYLIDTLKSGHVLRSDYSEDELKIIDESFGNKAVIEAVKQSLINGQVPTPEGLQQVKDTAMQSLNQTGASRYIEFPDDYFEDVDCKITINITGEQKNKAAILQSLSTIMQTVISSYNPNTGKFGVLEDPKLSRIFGTILELSGAGISPINMGISDASKDTTGVTSIAQTAAPLAPSNQIA